jgi:hypothetical protein
VGGWPEDGGWAAIYSRNHVKSTPYLTLIPDIAGRQWISEEIREEVTGFGKQKICDLLDGEKVTKYDSWGYM